jgi:hypothetical protein
MTVCNLASFVGGFSMSKLPGILQQGGWIGRALIICLGATCLRKLVEIIGRQTGLLRRNLGWGYVVDLTIPVALTGAAGLFFIIRRVASRHVPVKDSPHQGPSD